MPERHLWERQEGETSLAFAAFEIFRRLGPGRTVEEAWRRYWSRPGTRRRRPDESSPPRVMPYFSKWAVEWQWRERALAWDNEQTAIERDQRLDRELQEKAREHEEEMRQRQLMREEARAARAVARRLLRRLMQGVETGQLDALTVAQLLPHLQKISGLLETGQKLDRLSQGEPSEVTRRETDLQELIPKLMEIMKEFVAPERWEELARKLEEVDAAGA
jgi:hypothetical protein